MGNEAGYQAIITSILPVIATALEDEKPEVLLQTFTIRNIQKCGISFLLILNDLTARI